MSLIINTAKNNYQLIGELTKTNAKDLEKVLNKGLKKFNKVVINIEEVSAIDRHGVNIITKVHQAALNSNKSIAIIGYGCKDLYNHINTNTAA
ncbi:hypothetical protein FUA26_09450 [Seonamhaeicola algicola]|uniref:STAS domain-containing protein n=1 Tax=Seonamhaeicola algicola TaxID=1719036 RepID=A0A5C7AP15_9FLAO|nr:STAS domain-containing protein [Seonamhaeicola algicola]TXE09704.1 hypothetical protein FUA26_09450 [Seonamhaeicola algicola]